MDLEELLLVESALFSSGEPISIQDLSESLDLDTVVVRAHIRKLRGLYRKRNTSIEIAKVGSRYCMQVISEYRPGASRFSRTKIPKRLLKILTLIAYNQPIKQSKLANAFGPRVYKEVKELKELGLVHSVRSGQTKMLRTTKKFPEYFGIATTTKEGIKRWLGEKLGISDEIEQGDDGDLDEGDEESTDAEEAKEEEAKEEEAMEEEAGEEEAKEEEAGEEVDRDEEVDREMERND